jgi:hypothetical protein
MNNNQLDGSDLFDALQQKQARLDAFEALRPQWLRFYSTLGLIVFAVGLSLWWYPEVGQNRLTLLAFIALVGVAGYLQREIRRIDSRIDALYQLLKEQQ